MHDPSFSKRSLESVIEKRDFYGVGAAIRTAFKDAKLDAAEASAHSKFKSSLPLLSKFPLRGKTIFHFPKLENELVARKICENIASATQIKTKGRTEIVSSLRLLLEEGVPFRVYRLDISSFYESFLRSEVLDVVNALRKLSPHSKILINELLADHASIGGLGVPRGLSISALLSNLMMQKFDLAMSNNSECFFYARYVDDIIILTSHREDLIGHVRRIEKLLPRGLHLNPTKKDIFGADAYVSPLNSKEKQSILLEFDYLGYSFSVRDPEKIKGKKDGAHFRDVTIDIAAKKIRKLKTRISRAFYDFSKNRNWNLLKDRIKFLTMNFGVYNAKAGGKKLAGIYNSYPLVSSDAPGLKELDHFLRNAILSKSGRLCSLSAPLITQQQRSDLMRCSFAKGHEHKRFVYFSGSRLKEIQDCWKH